MLRTLVLVSSAKACGQSWLIAGVRVSTRVCERVSIRLSQYTEREREREREGGRWREGVSE
jgi:hypothetical protein